MATGAVAMRLLSLCTQVGGVGRGVGVQHGDMVGGRDEVQHRERQSGLERVRTVVNVMPDGGMRCRPRAHGRWHHGRSTVHLPSLREPCIFSLCL
jgi:hypothetical protein